MIYSLTYHTRILEQIIYVQATSSAEAREKADQKTHKAFAFLECSELADALNDLDPEEKALFDEDGVAVFEPEPLR